MSKYTTSPVNEAGMTRVEVVAVNGLKPKVIENTSNVGPAAQGVNGNPTVSTVDTIVATSETDPTAVTSDEAVGGTPVVIAPTSNVGGTPTAEGVSTPTAQGVTGNPTAAGSNGSAAQVVGNNPTVHLQRVIVATQGTTNVAKDLSPVTTARERLAA